MKNPKEFASPLSEAVQMEEIQQVEDDRFRDEIGKLIKQGEEMRLARAQSYGNIRRSYHFMFATLVICTATYLVWFILMGGDPVYLGIALAVTIIIPAVLNAFANKTAANYRDDYKSTFLPALAKALGQLTFHPTGGISMKALAPAQILPPHDIYKAEDCFAGTYKGVKLMISEARLYNRKRKGDPVFDGVLVLMMTQQKKFRGHTIITADQVMAKRWSAIRWKNLNAVAPAPGIKAGPFLIFSNVSEEAVQLADEDMMELMHKLSASFDDSKLSAVFYGGNKVLLAIPYEGDMFEPGDIYMPVTSRKDALKCKREIEQILQAIDIIDVYEPDTTLTAEKGPETVAEEE